MTSQDNSRKLRAAGESIDKCLLSQEMKYAYKCVEEDVPGIVTTRDHYRAFLCPRNVNTKLDNDGVDTANYRKSDKERGLKSYKSNDENDHPSKTSLRVQTNDFSHSSIADATQKLQMSSGSLVSQKLPVTVVSSDVSHKMEVSTVTFRVGKLNDFQVDNISNKDFTTPLREEKAVGVVGSARERYLSALGIENSTSNVCTAKYDHRRFELSLNNNIKEDSKPMKIYCRDQASKECDANLEINLSPLPVNTQGCCKGKHPLSKQLTKSSEALSLHAAFSACDSEVSEQVGLQKCRSSVSVNPSSLRATHCPSPDLQTSKPDISMSSDILNAATVQSLKSKFGGIEQASKTKLESASSCVCSQNPLFLCPRVKIKPSSTIQRIQEKLLQSMENEDAKCSVSKTSQKFVHKTISEQHQDTEIIVRESGGKNVFAHAEKLHKEEKPYRQWHRMSRVVTADSKFIIFPGLPCHVVSHTKQNNPVLKESAQSVKLDELNETEGGKDCSVVCEPEVTPVVDVPPSEQETETYENTEFHEAGLKTDCGVVEVSLTDVGVKSCDGEERQPENGGESLAITIHGTSSDDGAQCKPQINTRLGDNAENMSIDNTRLGNNAESMSIDNTRLGNNAENMSIDNTRLGNNAENMSIDNTRLGNNAENMSIDNTRLGNNAENMSIDKQLTEQDTTGTSVNESELSIRHIPKSLGSLSMPRNKSLNMETFHMLRYQSFYETSTSNTRDDDISPLSTDVDRMQPLNSVSGASQVTGPCFSEFKNDLYKLQSKKIKSGGPNLRTATRSRNRCNSPAVTPCSTNLFHGAESQKASSSRSRHNSRSSREGSRGVSSGRRSDSLRQREQRTGIKPRYARCARAQETELDISESINRNWSGRCTAAGEAQKESFVTLKKPRKAFLAVASKVMQKVNRASPRVPRNEPARKYTEVKATQDYNGALPGQLSFRKGQIIKQRSFVARPSDGMCYGYYVKGLLRKKKKGLFPMNCVTADEPDALDEVSLTFSAKSAV
ncbi:hypothetical protein BsWGS_02874 [Bradybaena similaris]